METKLPNKYPTFFDRYGGGMQADIGGAANLELQAQPEPKESMPYKFNPWVMMPTTEQQNFNQNPWEIAPAFSQPSFFM